MDILEAFLIGGGAIALTNYVANQFGPEYAALSLPLGIIASMFLNRRDVLPYYHSYAYIMAIITLTIFLIYGMNVYTDLDPNTISLIGLVVWLAISLAVVRFYLL